MGQPNGHSRCGLQQPWVGGRRRRQNPSGGQAGGQRTRNPSRVQWRRLYWRLLAKTGPLQWEGGQVGDPLEPGNAAPQDPVNGAAWAQQVDTAQELLTAAAQTWWVAAAQDQGPLLLRSSGLQQLRRWEQLQHKDYRLLQQRPWRLLQLRYW